METNNKTLLDNKWFCIWLIMLLGLVSFFNTFGNNFVYDDEFAVENNPAIRNLNNFPKYFTDGNTAFNGMNFEGDVYRPLVTLSYSLDYSIWKLNPVGYHITNLIFHILNGILIFLIIGIITGNNAVSVLTALFFITHPIQTDAVSWISGRGNVLFLFFYLSAFLMFIRSNEEQNKKNYYIGSLICFALALLSKEMAVTLPLILTLYAWYFCQKKDFLKRLVKISPYFLLVLLFLILRSAVLGKVSQRVYWGSGLYQTMITMAKVFVIYIKLLILPIKLCADYVYPVATSVLEPGVLISIGILIFLFVTIIKTFNKYRILSFAIAWFFITLLPVSNIIPLKILIAERFIYIPSIGFCLFLSLIIAGYYSERKRPILKNLGIIFSVLILIFYTTRTIIRNNDWKDSFTFWSNVIKSCPVNAKAHNNVGTHYKEMGLLDKAEQEYKTAISISPNYVTPHFNLAGLYIEKRLYNEALIELEKVIQIKPDFPNARKHYEEVFRYSKNRESKIIKSKPGIYSY